MEDNESINEEARGIELVLRTSFAAMVNAAADSVMAMNSMYKAVSSVSVEVNGCTGERKLDIVITDDDGLNHIDEMTGLDGSA